MLSRIRFKVRCDDYRPVVWPIKYPYWCTGTGEDHYTLVAYVESEGELLRLWPDAEDLDVLEEGNIEIRFTSRFSKPEWYQEDGSHYPT